MFIQRVHGELKESAQDNCLVIYGDSTLDEFVTEDYITVNLSIALHDALKGMGYRRVIFYRLRYGCYFYDTESKELCKPGTPVSRQPVKNRGVLGTRQLGAKKIQPQQQIRAAVSDERSIAIIDHCMRDSSIPTAVVFLDAQDIFNHIDVRRQLCSQASHWLAQVTPNRNLCCWVFTSPKFEQVCSHLEQHLPALLARIQGSSGNRSKFLKTSMRIASPDAAEIKRLLASMRLQGQISYEFRDIDKLSVWFAARSFLLRDWRAQFQKAARITREIAKRQGWIDTPLNDKSAEERLQELIGLESVKNRLTELASTIKIWKKKNIMTHQSLHMIFQGNPGTGKTTVARLTGEILRDLGILKRGHVKEVQSLAEIIAEHVGGTSPRMNQVIDEALDGVLFIDEAYQLAEEHNPFAREAMGTLLTRLENDSNRLCVILAGYPTQMEELLKTNPGLKSRFTHVINFEDYTPDQLYQILKHFLAEYKLSSTLEMEERLRNIVTGMYNKRDAHFGNARDMRTFAGALDSAWNSRAVNALDTSLPLEPVDIPKQYEIYEEIGRDARNPVDDLETILKEINQLTGLEKVKQTLASFAARQSIQRKTGTALHQPLHLIFEGNPGTGKTTVARLVGKMYRAMGALSSGHVHEVSSMGEIVAEHVGGTSPLMNKAVDEAMNGVLFIDEAYQLADENNPFAKQAVETLLTRLENDRDRLAVILAGYPSEMARLYKLNPGLKSRFPTVVTFDDYTPDELYTILEKFLALEKLSMADGMDELLKNVVAGMYAMRDKHFGNARAMRNLANALNNSWSLRAHKSGEVKTPLRPEDLPVEYEQYVATGKREREADHADPDAILAELDNLVGMDAVKAKLRSIHSSLQFDLARGRTPVFTKHLIFSGNPGTGKTTVAKQIARIYHALGCLEKNTCEDVSPAQIFGSYVGETEKKAEELFERAKGGVLFIDEAYSCCSHSFGNDFVTSLVRFMDANRDSTAVIVAGYADKIDDFLALNAGLSSRFKESNRIEFPDYTAAELAEIVGRLAAAENIGFPDNVRRCVEEKMAQEKLKPDFGNARAARNLFEDMKALLAERVKREHVDLSALVFLPEDIHT